MAQENSEQEPLARENAEQIAGDGDALSSAVKNLVENAIDEARAKSREQSVTFIAVEEEPLDAGEHPLLTTTATAGGGLKNAAGTTIGAVKSVTAWAINAGKVSAGAAAELARAAADYVKEEDVVDRATDLLQDAELEGKQAIKGAADLVSSFLTRS